MLETRIKELEAVAYFVRQEPQTRILAYALEKIREAVEHLQIELEDRARVETTR